MSEQLIIIKNKLHVDVLIDDIGYILKADTTSIISDQIKYESLCNSDSLKALINDGTTLIINDGINDLSIDEALNLFKRTSSYYLEKNYYSKNDVTSFITTQINNLNFSDINIDSTNLINNPSYLTNLSDFYNFSQSGGHFEGFDITDNGDGSINVSGGTGLLREEPIETSRLITIKFNPVNNLYLTDNQQSYLVANNQGSIYIVNSQNDFNCMNICIIANMFRDGTHIDYMKSTANNIDSNRKYRRKEFQQKGIVEIGQGSKVSNPSGLYIYVSAGSFQHILSNVDSTAIDTLNGDTFVSYYRNGSGGQNKIEDLVEIDNLHYDDGSGTLGNLNSGKQTSFQVFQIPTSHGNHVIVVYDQNIPTNSLVDQEILSLPTNLPPIAVTLGCPIAQIIIQKSSTYINEIRNVENITFVSNSSTLHNNLNGLQGGTLNEYYHLTNTEANNVGIIPTLQSNLNTETSNRISSDSTLQTQINNLNASIKNVNGTIFSSDIIRNRQLGDSLDILYSYSSTASNVNLYSGQFASLRENNILRKDYIITGYTFGNNVTITDASINITLNDSTSLFDIDLTGVRTKIDNNLNILVKAGNQITTYIPTGTGTLPSYPSLVIFLKEDGGAII